MALGPIMLGIAGTRLEADEREMLLHPATGGVILFDRNYDDPDQLRALVEALHSLRQPQLLVAVDQEGGRVQRFRAEFTALPAAATLGEQFDREPDVARELARGLGWIMAVELRASAIDFSFAPVLDLGTRRSRVIGERALHREPKVVAALARAMMRGMAEAGMCAVGKHFPGHGNVAEDSHVTMPVDRRALEQIRNTDLMAFQRMVGYGIPAIMASHVCYPQADDQPAGFSRFWLKRILREELEFGGAVFSDDLGMAAAEAAGDVPSRVSRALDAGCDMALICNDRPGAEAALDRLSDFGSALRSARLARLHGRTTVTRDELARDPRYLELSSRIAALQRTPELDLGDDMPI